MTSAAPGATSAIPAEPAVRRFLRATEIDTRMIGMIFALADTAFAYACNSRNVNTVAQSATVNFLAPGQLGDRLVAEAREEALTGRSGVYHVTVRNQKDEKIAVFQGLSRSIGGPILDGD